MPLWRRKLWCLVYKVPGPPIGFGVAARIEFPRQKDHPRTKTNCLYHTSARSKMIGRANDGRASVLIFRMVPHVRLTLSALWPNHCTSRMRHRSRLKFRMPLNFYAGIRAMEIRHFGAICF